MTSSTPSSSRSIDQHTTSTTQGRFLNSQSPALRGASIAFRTPQPPLKPLSNTYSGRNGALAAATKAGLGSQKEKGNAFITMMEIQSPRTSQEILSNLTGERNIPRASSRSMEALRLLPTSSSSSRQPSPSQIAAKLAAARSTPTPVHDSGVSTTGRVPQWARGSSGVGQEHKDESSIPATNALVQLFESKARSTDVEEKATNSLSSARSESRSRVVLSPKPIRPSVSLRLSSHSLNETARYAEGKVAAAPKTAERRKASPRPVNKSVSPKSATLLVTGLIIPTDSLKDPPQLPPPRRTRRSSTKEVASNQTTEKTATAPDGSSSDSSYASARDSLSRTATLNLSTAPKPLGKPTITVAKRPISQPPKPFPPRRPSVQSFASTTSYTKPLPYRLTPQLTADSLANAMVASSLASSRAPSPSKPPPQPPLPRRYSRPFFLPNRTPSPTKGMGMRHTLRKDVSSSEEEPERRRNHVHLLKKHPNKHAEGDRKRWRDSITEKERKRYEGLWAANRGLLLSPQYFPSTKSPADSSLASCVHAYVVRDIWQRSHLPTSTLSGIWELVDGLGKGRLRREEFLVGLWLVDQCLKGRKLPVKVGESVWESVRVVGVKVKGGGGGVR